MKTKQSAEMTKWLAGKLETEDLPECGGESAMARLRLVEIQPGHENHDPGAYVETSRGNIINLDAAKEALPMLLKALKTGEDDGSLEVGGYGVEVHPAMPAHLVIECHRIAGDEVVRLARLIKACKPKAKK